MKRVIFVIGLSALLVSFFIVLVSYGVYAGDPPPDAFYRPTKDNPSVEAIDNLGADESFSVSLLTGAATYAYPLNVPEGTGGLKPTLSIFYNHQSSPRPGLIGTSWSLTQNYIQRDVNHTRNDTSDDEFKLIFNGELHDLIYDTSDERYHTEIESYLHIQNVSGGNNTYGDYWIVKIKDGTSYRFGFNNDSEQTSNIENYTVRWYLDLINDTYDNGVYYSYKEDPNSEDLGITYPDKISYNNDESRKIEFVLESSARPDIWEYYENSNRIKMSRRLKEIHIITNNDLVRKYVLNYSYLDTRSFLNKIELYGNDNSSLLYSDSFSYHSPEKGWYEAGDNWDSPYAFNGIAFGDAYDLGVRFSDVDRDGHYQKGCSLLIREYLEKL